MADGHVHTMPTYGKEHSESKDCWCMPTLDYQDADTGCQHWVHKSPEETFQ